MLDRQDLLANRVNLDKMGHPDQLDQKDHQEHPDNLETTVNLVSQEPPVNPVQPEKKVFARNTVPLMVESSLKMEPVVVKNFILLLNFIIFKQQNNKI